MKKSVILVTLVILLGARTTAKATNVSVKNQTGKTIDVHLYSQGLENPKLIINLKNNKTKKVTVPKANCILVWGSLDDDVIYRSEKEKLESDTKFSLGDNNIPEQYNRDNELKRATELSLEGVTYTPFKEIEDAIKAELEE